MGEWCEGKEREGKEKRGEERRGEEWKVFLFFFFYLFFFCFFDKNTSKMSTEVEKKGPFRGKGRGRCLGERRAPFVTQNIGKKKMSKEKSKEVKLANKQNMTILSIS